MTQLQQLEMVLFNHYGMGDVSSFALMGAAPVLIALGVMVFGT